MKRSEKIGELAKALAKAQGSFETIPAEAEAGGQRKDGSGGGRKWKYATLATVIDKCRKPLSENGLAITQTTSLTDHGWILTTTLIHADSDQWISSDIPVAVGGNVWDMGSSLTYMKRYQYLAVLAVAPDEEDDDGQAAQDANLKPAVTNRRGTGGASQGQRGVSRTDNVLINPGLPDGFARSAPKNDEQAKQQFFMDLETALATFKPPKNSTKEQIVDLMNKMWHEKFEHIYSTLGLVDQNFAIDIWVRHERRFGISLPGEAEQPNEKGFGEAEADE
jgi:hypothetical protein